MPPRFEAFLHAAEDHAPGDLHELGLALVSDELVHFDATALPEHRDAQVGNSLVAGDRNVVVLEVPAHRDERRRRNHVVGAAHPRTPLHGAREPPVDERHRHTEQSAVFVRVGEAFEHDIRRRRDIDRHADDELDLGRRELGLGQVRCDQPAVVTRDQRLEAAEHVRQRAIPTKGPIDAHRHQPAVAEHGEMLRDRRCGDLEGGRDVAGGELTVADQPQDLAPYR